MKQLLKNMNIEFLYFGKYVCVRVRPSSVDKKVIFFMIRLGFESIYQSGYLLKLSTNMHHW